MEAYTKTIGVHLLDVPYHLDIEYTYYVPDHATQEFAVGEFVLVPFGGANKKCCALITSVGTTHDYSRLKPVLSAINESLSLSDEMMALVSFLCDRTLCTVGDAVRRLIPADAFSRADEVFSPTNAELDTPLNVKATAVYSFIAEHAPVSVGRLEKQFGTDVRAAIKTLLAHGYITSDTVIKEARGAVEEFASLSEHADPSLLAKPRTPEEQRRLFAEIADAGRIRTRALIDAGYKTAHLRALEKKGLIILEKEELLRNHYQDIRADQLAPITLSEEQQAAFDLLSKRMDENKPHAALLHGVTGSGKTSVILALCEHAIASGKNAIVLIPEIALTWQSVSVFAAKFGTRAALLHSGLSDGERFDTFKRIRRGEVSVVLGTRSALFMPLKNIGLIVIDEEQEYTYKSDMSPKYHARDIAKHRAAKHGALLVLASATPSVESFYEASLGKYELVSLKKRYSGSALPAVTIADMRLSHEDPDAMIGSELRAKLCEAYEAGEQSMLFLNRRGYNSLLSCRACGEPLLCPNCSVSLTHHKTKKGSKLICHYCGYSIPVPHFCPKCASEHLSFAGCGTQRIEEEISGFLPDARIMRMDADTTRARFSQDELTAAFGRGEADILVGTQMIAKGHNFPKVTLVGVIAADGSLFLDDFRAGERTFSLITQVVGRAGRAKGGGSAVIQTYNPENETIRLSAAQNYDAFYRNEIAVRKGLTFPPFCDIAVFLLTADEESELRTFATEFANAIAKKQQTEYDDVKLLLFGPFEAPVFKVKNKYRMRIVLKFKNNKRARTFFSDLLRTWGKKAQGKVSIAIDINPTST